MVSACSVLRAYPVREMATEDDSINVEMDPEDEWRVRQQIDEAGMRCAAAAAACLSVLHPSHVSGCAVRLHMAIDMCRCRRALYCCGKQVANEWMGNVVGS